MANDLSDLDHLSPASTDLISQGDDKIRETREKIKNWAIPDLGNTNAEHYDDGPHSFPYGVGTPPGFSGLPAPGHENRMAFDATNGAILLDKAGTWVFARTQPFHKTLANGPIVLTGVYQTILTLSSVVAHAGATLLIHWGLVHTTAALTQIFVRVSLNGDPSFMFPGQYAGYPTPSTSFAGTHNGSSWYSPGAGLIVGANTITLQALCAGAGSVTAIAMAAQAV